MTSLLSSSLFVIITLFTELNACNRYRQYGEPCLGQYGAQQSDVCDYRRMLKCDQRIGTCQCPDFYRDFYDTYNARCYHRVGTACEEKFGGLSESYYGHGCPDNSFCNPGTGYCGCKPLFRQNYDGTGCFLPSGSGTFRYKGTNQDILLLSLFFGLLVPLGHLLFLNT